MDRADWARLKLIFFRDIAKEVPEKAIKPENHLWFRLLASLPMSFVLATAFSPQRRTGRSEGDDVSTPDGGG